MAATNLRIGIVGAGIGGLMAAIAIAQAGASVTILEAAEQLGEIGAGIQMTPNVARLLIRYGVDKVIGDNLVRFSEVNLRQKDGTKVGWTPIKRIEDTLGYPWWVVHRHHLHNGLVEVARRSGVEIIISSRVTHFEQGADGEVTVTTNRNRSFTFHLVVGSDGLRSIVRQTLFPHVAPRPPSGNCAYRAIVPIAEIREDPLTRSIVEDENGQLVKRMDVWMASTGYIIGYPISNAKDYNMVLSHFCEPPVDSVQEVTLEEVIQQCRDYDDRIQRIVAKIRHPVSRWPLLVTGPLASWSNAERNVVLIGDAAHSMTNHMAQGAATSMEDGAFLARCLRLVLGGRASLSEAIELYEQGRMPKASYKQQLSYLNGWLWQLPEGAAQRARDAAMRPELKGETLIRSPNLYGDPLAVRECYGYDAEEHADEVVATWLNRGQPVRDAASTVVKPEADKVANWFLPPELAFKIRSHL